MSQKVSESVVTTMSGTPWWPAGVPVISPASTTMVKATSVSEQMKWRVLVQSRCILRSRSLVLHEAV